MSTSSSNLIKFNNKKKERNFVISSLTTITFSMHWFNNFSINPQQRKTNLLQHQNLLETNICQIRWCYMITTDKKGIPGIPLLTDLERTRQIKHYGPQSIHRSQTITGWMGFYKKLSLLLSISVSWYLLLRLGQISQRLQFWIDKEKTETVTPRDYVDVKHQGLWNLTRRRSSRL